MKHLLLSLIFVLASVTAFAQTRTVSGTVRDAAGNPMPGVAVTVPGTTIGTVTDIDGRYTLKVEGSATTLKAAFIGMREAAIDLAAGQTDATMVEDNKEMDEVVVVAYGTSTKGTYTGSAAQIGSETLAKRQVSNPTAALSGTMPGVQTLSANGQPGVSSTIRIRGIGSINGSAAPLIVVDGMPFDGDLSSINTNDIESMTVLKDASSTALYGARGANGIVMITTKKGKSGDAKVTFEGRWGSNSRQIENYDVLKSPVEYTEILYSAYKNAYVDLLVGDYGYPEDAAQEAAHGYALSDLFENPEDYGFGYNIFTVPNGEDVIGADGKINPNATLGYSDGYYYYLPDDWQKETFKNQFRQQYDVTVQGGADKFNYYLSLGYLDDGGIIEGSGFSRFSTRAKVEYQAKNWLKLSTNLAYNHSKSRYPDEQTTTNSSGNAFFIANFIAPVIPLYVRDTEGNIMRDNQGRILYDYGDGNSTNGYRNWMSNANPLGDLTFNKEEYLKDIFNGNVEATITPIKGLSLTAKYSMYIDNTRYNYLGNVYQGQSSEYGGSVAQSHSRDYAFDQQYIGNYNFTVADINAFDITVGYDGYHSKYNYISGYGTHIYNPESYMLSNASGDFSISGSQSTYATAGVFARLNYTFDEKYIVNGSYRRDSSSRFSEDNRWGDFFSVSAGWVISKENFMSPASWVDMLKLKASYGEQGNDNVGNDYAWQDQYSVTGSNGVWNDVKLTYKGNPDLTWETSKSWNVGLDFALFKNKLVGSVEYFGRKTSDMLYNKPVAGSNGFSSMPMNVGAMTNSGVEIDLNINALRLEKFNWDINLNATFLKNEINELHPDLQGQLIDGTRIYEEGESMYRMYLVEWAGVDEATGDPMWYYTDKNGDRVATTDYQTAQTAKIATDDLLPAVYGGFGTNLEFFGFDASVSFAYQLGGHIYDSGYETLMSDGDDAGVNFHTDIRKAWTPENTKTDVPRMNHDNTYANATSTRFLTKSDYLALNNITFGYTVPADLTRKLYLENVRVYFAADNVALWSKREGLDPRQSFTSATTARYTPIRTISGGIKITF